MDTGLPAANFPLPGCAVAKVRIDRDGYVTSLSVVRQKGDVAQFLREAASSTLVFELGSAARAGYMTIAIPALPGEPVESTQRKFLERAASEEQRR